MSEDKISATLRRNDTSGELEVVLVHSEDLGRVLVATVADVLSALVDTRRGRLVETGSAADEAAGSALVAEVGQSIMDIEPLFSSESKEVRHLAPKGSKSLFEVVSTDENPDTPAAPITDAEAVAWVEETLASALEEGILPSLEIAAEQEDQPVLRENAQRILNTARTLGAGMRADVARLTCWVSVVQSAGPVIVSGTKLPAGLRGWRK